MKTPSRLAATFKSTLIMSIFCLAAHSVQSQTDTLHLYFKGLQTPILDSNDAKIGAWAKSLKGRHVDVKVLAYYEKSEFKKYSQDRCDELFIAINRKARDLVTIKSNEPVKGEKSQRSTVDIVYYTSGSSDKPIKEKEKEKEKPVADTKKENSEKPKEKQKEKVRDDEKEKVTVEEKKKEKEEKKSEKKEDKEKKEVAEKKENKKSPKVEIDNSGLYEYDSLYVNGELQVIKRKIKKKK